MSRDKTLIHEMSDRRTTASNESAYLTVIAGLAIGKMFKLAGEEMLIGRSPDAHVCLDDEGVSRRHARIERTDDGGLRVLDLQSTNGTWLDGQRITARVLRDGDKIQVGPGIVLRFNYQDALEEQFQQQLYESATRDGLTRIYNKRFFLDRLEQEFSYALRHDTPLSLVLFDIDHFKRINDTHGHPVGDIVLQELVDRVADVLRIDELFCRYGGEEFTIVMRDTTAELGWNAAERVRHIVAAHPFTHAGGAIRISVSAGVATLERSNMVSTTALIAEADRQLYAAKQAGRNRVSARVVPTSFSFG